MVYVQKFGTFAHFAGPHEVIGLIVVFVGTLQPLNAFFRPHKAPEGEKQPTKRVAWELYHKGAGYLCIVGAIIAVAIGLQYLAYLKYDALTQNVALGLAIALGGSCLLLLAVSFTPVWPRFFPFLAKLVGAGSKDLNL